MRLPSFLVLILVATSGCATYRDDLNRGQRFYSDTQYAHALAVWRELEPDMDSLRPEEQVRYAYLRGMTDERLGFRADARHWLAVAQALDALHPGGLEQDAKVQLETTLGGLNRQVWSAARGIPIPEPAAPISATAAPVQP